MKLNKFKNTILLVYLAIFLFGLFVPFSQSFAQSQSSPLFIEAGKLALNSGDDVFIAARTWNLGNKDITFKISSDNGKTFSSTVDGVTLSGGGICTTGSVGSDYKASCQISFKSTKNGTFILKASLVFNGPKNSNEVTLVVTGKTTEIVCTPPKILNTAKDACIDPPVPIPPETPTPPVNTNTTYTPLAPLPGLSTPNCVGTDGKPCIDTQDSTKKPNPDDSNLCPFGNYLNIMIKLIIGIAAVLAMVMIVMGGIQYMTSDLISSKEAGKEQITHAVLGLLLALGAYLILNTINPQLLSACLDKLPQATIVISPEQQSIIDNRAGKGNCAVVTNPISACHPDKLTKDWFGRDVEGKPFSGDTSAKEPFKKLSAQASAICQLESVANVDAPSPNGTGITKTIDYCKNDKTIFSFGLFQINLFANGSNITNSKGEKCGNLFDVPGGGNYIVKNPAAPGGYEYNCKLKDGQQTRYENCKNYLLNSTNNIKEAYRLYQNRTPKWKDWSTYESCKNKF